MSFSIMTLLMNLTLETQSPRRDTTIPTVIVGLRLADWQASTSLTSLPGLVDGSLVQAPSLLLVLWVRGLCGSYRLERRM